MLRFASPFRRLSTTARKSLGALRKLYDTRSPITMLTVYDYPTALHADRADVDIVLVGDSVGMVVMGDRTTQSVTMENMVHHCRAARKGVKNALLVADLPFGSYESCVEKGVENAIRLVKEAGADAIKLEGGVSREKLIREVVSAGVAVMGHVGLLPQSVSRLGSFRSVGRNFHEANDILKDAKAVERAGAFAMVVECIPARVAGVITQSVDIPTLGIGSGNMCNGQVLVYHDMLGIMSHPHHDKVAPRFSKSFAEVGHLIDSGIREYCKQVRSREFPCERYSPYQIADKDFAEFSRGAEAERKSVDDGQKKGRDSNTEENITVY